MDNPHEAGYTKAQQEHAELLAEIAELKEKLEATEEMLEDSLLVSSQETAHIERLRDFVATEELFNDRERRREIATELLASTPSQSLALIQAELKIDISQLQAELKHGAEASRQAQANARKQWHSIMYGLNIHEIHETEAVEMLKMLYAEQLRGKS